MKVQALPDSISMPSAASICRLTRKQPEAEVFSIPEDEAAPSLLPGKTCPILQSPLSSLTGLASGWMPEKGAGASPERAVSAYSRADSLKSGGLPADMAKYKDDQLLRNPGGDAYDLRAGTVAEDLQTHRSFTRRVGKDLSDAWENGKRFFQNLAFGSETAFRDPSGHIRTTRCRGLLGTLGDFIRNTASALTLGFYTPEGESRPSRLQERLLHFLRKSKQAIWGDIAQGVPSSINRMGKSLILTGWNLVEVLPDTMAGQLDAGRKMTTTVFDDGQVLVEYLTDVIPGGDAWLRVHAGSFEGLKAPVLYNLSQPEHSMEDARWETVRNTPFRKTIETIGTLLADAVVLGAIGQTLSNGRRRDDR